MELLEEEKYPAEQREKNKMILLQQSLLRNQCFDPLLPCPYNLLWAGWPYFQFKKKYLQQ